MDIDSDEDDRDIFSEVRGSRPCSTKIFQLLRTAVVALRCSICPAIKWSWVRFLPNVGLFFLLLYIMCPCNWFSFKWKSCCAALGSSKFFFNADCLFKLAKAYLLGLFFSILFLSGL